MERGGPPGELRHHCAMGDEALYIIGVWESEQHVRTRPVGGTGEFVKSLDIDGMR